MDLFMVILRLIHIFAGIVWVGAGFFMFLIVIPTMAKMRNGQVMQNIMTHSRYSMIMGASAGLTVLAGILLYGRVYSSDWLSTAPGIVLTIGAVAGILAAGHGGAVLSRLQAEQMKLSQAIAAQNGPPNEAHQAEMAALQQKMQLHVRISLILLVIAVVGMSSWRYF